jgi:hypothetical protein
MRKIITLAIIILLTLSYMTHAEYCILDKEETKGTEGTISFISKKQLNEEVVIVPEGDPFFGIIGASMACWYDTPNLSGLKPLLVQKDGELTNHQIIFLEQYLNIKNRTILVLGEHLNTTYHTTEVLGSPSEVAVEAARHAFVESSTVMVIPYGTDDAYKLSLIASPLASYLNIPVLIYDENENELQEICNDLNVRNGYLIGDILPDLPGINIIKLENEDEIQNTVLTIIKERFGEINYITMTNPSDVIPPYVINTNETRFTDHITNTKLTFLGKAIDIKGEWVKNYAINIPSGINRIQIHANITESGSSFMDKIDSIVPIISLFFYDKQDNIVAYSSSFGYDFKKTYIETLACNASGNYKLKVNIYNGIKGGYFTQRGISVVDTDFEISIKISELEKPHMPLIPNLSMTASYLTSAHGGIIIADSNFGLTSNGYATMANGSGTGPWYNEKLHNFTNTKVNYTIEQLEETLSLLDNQEMLQNYLNGPAWLSILADTNMIPMYYYGPSQGGIYDKGLPSDNPYSLDWNLSVGRTVSYDVQDVSLLISRTLLYQDICGEPAEQRDWHNKFSFIFGEGFGETGGIFHQIPYSFEIRKYGFQPQVYGDLRNGRQMTNLLETYTGSNYIEYLGHGDWFWYTPSIYGLDMYSKAIDVAHAKNWVYSKPSIFLTSACLMGRIDGIPPNMNIGLTMLHAGCNCFVGATRMTGSEAGLTTFENHLIVDDLSVGEALRGEKRVDREPPTYYVRVLYGDPAFNPYEPNNGFSNQGRPDYN